MSEPSASVPATPADAEALVEPDVFAVGAQAEPSASVPASPAEAEAPVELAVLADAQAEPPAAVAAQAEAAVVAARAEVEAIDPFDALFGPWDSGEAAVVAVAKPAVSTHR